MTKSDNRTNVARASCPCIKKAHTGWKPVLLMLLLLGVVAHAQQPVELSTLDLTKMTAGWGKAQANQSITQKPLTIAGVKFDKGVGTHADSTMYIALPDGAQKFTAQVGVDDACASDKASIRFRIYGDGKKLFDSGILKWKEAAKSVDVELKGIKTLVLNVSSTGDGVAYDHGNWADAVFVVTGDAPKAASAPREEPYILTPKAPETPRINGPKLWGCRPGNPFLFTIPATGKRPMTFAVDNLPAGLSVDPKTGIITGVVKERGDYVVTFKAKNELGEASRAFKIVCGDTLALTPHMGWNSWYVWENHVTDKIMRDAADAMVSSGMINHGWMYVNIDDCWSIKPGSKDVTLMGKERDERGRINSNPRFPDMKAMTDYIHSKGLKAGIYTSPGPRTCAGFVAAYKHEEDDATRYAEWGFDFLKYDWCSYTSVSPDRSLKNVEELKRPYKQMGDILKKQPRDIVLNLCQYGMGNVWEWGKEVGGHSWRTAGDLGLTYEGIPAALFRDGFGNAGREKFGGPGGWNDPDYLLLGYLSNWKGGRDWTPLSPNEQYTHVSLWCLLAAPLIFSGDITKMDEFTLSLLTNDEVIAVDQDPLGKPGKPVSIEDELEVWAKPMDDGSLAVGLFNRGEGEVSVTAAWKALGIEGKHIVRDLWRQKDLGEFTEKFEAKVPRHGVVFVTIRRAQ